MTICTTCTTCSLKLVPETLLDFVFDNLPGGLFLLDHYRREGFGHIGLIRTMQLIVHTDAFEQHDIFVFICWAADFGLKSPVWQIDHISEVSLRIGIDDQVRAYGPGLCLPQF